MRLPRRRGFRAQARSGRDAIIREGRRALSIRRLVPKERPVIHTRPQLAADLRALIARITRGPGVTPPEARQAAADGRFEGELAAYLEKVRSAPTSVTDDEVAALRAAGHTDDELFELTVATALGAARERLETGLSAIAAAFDTEA